MLKLARPWVLLLSGALILASSSCSPKDDERALRELVEKAARFAEQHDIGEIIELTTEDFQAQPGDLDRRGAKRILFMAFRHYGELKVVYPQPSVEIESREGGPLVSFPFLIVKKDQSVPKLKKLYNDPKGWMEEVGEGADLYRFKLKVEKVDGDWRVKRACLERFTGVGFSKCKVRDVVD
ncbi:MAG: hypothetical protein V1689_05345 [Pseudomonadota bacterium]